MTKRILFITLFLSFISCSKEFEIEGKWLIVSQEAIKERPLPASHGPVELVDFFGPTAWSQCEGKYFEFGTEGEVHTNMFPDSDLQRLNFKYQFNSKSSKLIFTAEHPFNKEEIQMKHPVEVISNTEMHWTLSEFLKIKLERIE